MPQASIAEKMFGAGIRVFRERAARHRPCKTWIILGASPLAFIPSAAGAQEPAKSIPAEAQTAAEVGQQDEIIVTARRREENQQDVPISITALGGESLREGTVLRLDDLARVVPGFTATQSARGGASPSYSIRGQRGPTTQTLLLDPAVSLYFAEFRAG